VFPKISQFTGTICKIVAKGDKTTTYVEDGITKTVTEKEKVEGTGSLYVQEGKAFIVT
jgi:hypothetical protein